MWDSWKNKIKGNPRLKETVINLLMHPTQARPRLWLRLFQWAYMKRGKHTVIYRSVRRDIVPFNQFTLGDCSVVEDFCCINNAVGDLHIGHHSRIGLHNTIIGPVRIGNHVNLAQGVVVSGLNHNFNNLSKRIDEQGVSTSPIVICDDVDTILRVSCEDSQTKQRYHHYRYEQEAQKTHRIFLHSFFSFR